MPYPRGKIRNSEDPSIRGLTEKNVTNLRFMMKEKGKDPYALIEIDKARTILINSIREIKRDIYMSTVDKGYTVVLIFNAEKLCIPQPTSANALLKVLEEPPERTVFILVTSEVATLIDTIKSRCRQVFFPPIPWEKIQQHLKGSAVPEDRARIIANIANGDMRLARKLVDDIDDLLFDLKQLIRACYSSSPGAWEKVMDRISSLKRKGITDLSYFFRTGILYFRDLLVMSQSGQSEELVFEILAEHMKKMDTEHPNANWHACIDILEDTYENIQRNGFVTLMASTMLIDLHKQINGEVSQPFTIHDWIHA
jgi:DNA polymerase-3 subunit delta'